MHICTKSCAETTPSCYICEEPQTGNNQNAFQTLFKPTVLSHIGILFNSKKNTLKLVTEETEKVELGHTCSMFQIL